MFLFGPPNIEKLKVKHDIKGLLNAFEYTKNIEIRIQAAVDLGILQDPAAVDGLIAALKDEEQGVRLAAVHGLGLIGSPQAINALIESLEFKSKPCTSGRYSSFAKFKGCPNHCALSQIARPGRCHHLSRGC